MVLDRYATYAGSDPRRAPAALAVIPYVEQTFGSWYVRGGLHRLALAVHDRAVERGAVVRTGSDVAEVIVESGRAAGVRLASGERIAADVVVANADASHLYADLVPASAGQPARRRLRKATPSLSGFVLLLALRGRTPGLGAPHGAVPAQTTTRSSTPSSAGPPAPVADPTVYVSAPDDPATRPDDDSEAWFVLVNAPRHGHGAGAIDWTAPGLADSYADRVLAVLAERGLDVRDRLLWREIRTPADLESGRARPAAPSTAPRPTAPAPRSCARRTARRCRACSSSAARRIPAAVSPWSACRQRSSPS